MLVYHSVGSNPLTNNQSEHYSSYVGIENVVSFLWITFCCVHHVITNYISTWRSSNATGIGTNMFQYTFKQRSSHWKFWNSVKETEEWIIILLLLVHFMWMLELPYTLTLIHTPITTYMHRYIRREVVSHGQGLACTHSKNVTTMSLYT